MKKLITLVALPIMLLFFTMTLCSCDNGTRIFNCKQYDLVMGASTSGTERRDNLLTSQTNRLILYSDGTFVMQEQQKETMTTIEYFGNYSEVDNIITLSYIDDYPDEKLSIPVYTISDDGRTLSRIQNVYNENNQNQILWTVEQIFTK